MQAQHSSIPKNAAAAPSVLRNEVQAAQFLGVSPRALQKWRVTGQGPQFLRLSARCIRYSQSELIRWTESHACHATAQYASERR